MLEQLKKEVLQANLDLVKYDLVKFTWGNVSAVDRKSSLFVIKPSGVNYEEMTIKDMVVCDFNGKVIEGDMKPSSDTATHAVLYREFPNIGGIVHTHSLWATIWAQAGLNIPVLGTTHADTFYGEIPCARLLSNKEIDISYEEQTGNVIVETFENNNLDPMKIPAVLLQGHGPFTWGKDAQSAVMNSVILDEIAKINFHTRELNHFSEELPQYLLDKHYLRKHGKQAYYGQK